MNSAPPSTPQTPLDVRIVALDETEYYSIDPDDAPYIESIMGIYMYDANRLTCLAEAMPSYFLYHIENQVRVSERGRLLSDHAQECLYLKYEHCLDNDDHYVHVYYFDALVEKLKGLPYRYKVIGEEPIPDGCTYDDVVEGVIEYCRGNAQL